MHDVVVTAVRAAVSAATIIFASMSKILFLSIFLIENWKLKVDNLILNPEPWTLNQSYVVEFILYILLYHLQK